MLLNQNKSNQTNSFPKPGAPAPAKFQAKSVALMCTAGYISLDEPDRLSGKKGGTFILDLNNPTTKAGYDAIEESVLDVIENATGSREVPANYSLPFRSNQDTKPDGTLVFKAAPFQGPNKLIVTARTQFDVATVSGPNRSPCEPGEIHGGDLVMIEVRPFAYSQGANSGVSLGLGAVWLLEKGQVRIGRGAAVGASFTSADLGNFSFSVSGGEYE